MLNSNRLLKITMTVFACGVIACIVLAVLTPDEPRNGKEIALELKPELPNGPEVPVQPAKRLPIAGAEGFFVTIDDDGSSYLETPDGVREKLADAKDAFLPPVETIVRKAAERAVHPSRKNKITQLVICDTGVVDVPTDAVITFVGPNKVVALNGDGSSTAYYTDGKVEQRDRVGRRGPPGKLP